MEGEDGEGLRLSKRFNENKNSGSGEVDYKTKAGTAWSHSYLNQKPWHPLSYPNQRRKWIAEQSHAQRQRRDDEVAREYAQEQEFFRQTALISKKEKEKIEMMKAVSFMYVRPPGYNTESAKAAEAADEMKRREPDNNSQPPATEETSAIPPKSVYGKGSSIEEKKKSRPKDVFGRPLPTEEEFEVLKNAPRLETGVPARVKPFGIELRNVKCVRCGNYGHQSGDRECPLKDVIMPNEESRLKRDDPLTTIMAQMDPSEPLKWELKQKPGMSPPRGGFDPNDPNQQIVAEDIFDEYGGFLSGGNIPDLLTSFSPTKLVKKSKKSKRKRESSPRRKFVEPDKHESSLPLDSGKRRSKKDKVKKEKQQHKLSDSSSTESEFGRHSIKGRSKHFYSSEDSDSDRYHRSKHSREKNLSYEECNSDKLRRNKNIRRKRSHTAEDSSCDKHRRKEKSECKLSYWSSDDSKSHGHYGSNKHHSKYCHRRSDS